MGGRGDRSFLDNERTIYIRFPCQNSELDESVVKRLFAQFGGFSKMFMKSDANFAFAVYESPEQALYICEILNGIRFMGEPLIVKPRDKTKNADLFLQSPHSRPNRQPPQPVFYDQLSRIQFEDFDPRVLLPQEDSQGSQDY